MSLLALPIDMLALDKYSWLSASRAQRHVVLIIADTGSYSSVKQLPAA